MTKRKNNKNKTGTDLSSLEESSRVSIAASERGYEAREVPSPFPGTSVAGRKSASGPKQLTREEMDEDLILTYLAYDRLLEQALVRSGFVRASGSYKQVLPDWYRWARHIEKQFDPNSSDELQMAVEYLLSLREEMEELPGRRQNRIQWESSSSYSDILWLTEMLQETNVQLTHRYNFAETPGCDAAQVMALLLIVEAWLQLVPGR